MVDYQNCIEIKSQRNYSDSYITLFTKSPDEPRRANAFLKNTFGYPDSEHPDIKVLHTSIFYKTYNTCKNIFSFKLELNKDKLFLLVKDIKSNNIVSDIICWKFDTLKNIINQKCSLIAFIGADTIKNGATEQFHFTGCKLLSDFNFEKFIEAVKNNDIMFDIRIGSYKSGKNYGKPHDHGSGFRIHKNKLLKYYKIEEI